jgi:hypothetical protein
LQLPSIVVLNDFMHGATLNGGLDC